MAHFMEFAGGLNGKKVYRRGRHIIWMAIVWVLWLTRNNIIFQGVVVDFSVIAHIKILSCSWSNNRKCKNYGVVYLDWCSNPLECVMLG